MGGQGRMLQDAHLPAMPMDDDDNDDINTTDKKICSNCKPNYLE